MSHLLFRPRPPIALLVLAGFSTAQTTWHVDRDNCPATGAGTQENPFCRIQSALDAAASGDRILVRAGLYDENLRFGGKDVLVRAVEGREATRLAGSGGVGPIVTFDAGEGPGAVLEGFTIGTTFGASGQQGVLCDASSPTVRDNLFSRLHSNRAGGGLSILNGSSPEIAGNHILDCESTPGVGLGGGLYSDSSAPWIHGNVIEGCSAFYDGGGVGGGMAISGGSALIENNLFLNNFACDRGFGIGGGLSSGGASLVLTGNTFRGNAVCTSGPRPSLGGAIYISSGDATIRDTIFAGNLGASGSDVYAAAGATVDVQYTRLPLTAGSLEGPVTLGAGTTDALPQFVGDHDSHLAPTSPLIDAGTPGTGPGGTDGDLDPRLLDGNADGVARIDMGWDEVNPTRVAVSGTAALGATLTLDTSAPAGWNYLLAFARGRADVPLGSLGSVLISTGSVRLIAAGSTPGTDTLTIPALPALFGEAFFVQALGRDPSGTPGSFSRRLEFVIQ